MTLRDTFGKKLLCLIRSQNKDELIYVCAGSTICRLFVAKNELDVWVKLISVGDHSFQGTAWLSLKTWTVSGLKLQDVSRPQPWHLEIGWLLLYTSSEVVSSEVTFHIIPLWSQRYNIQLNIPIWCLNHNTSPWHVIGGKVDHWQGFERQEEGMNILFNEFVYCPDHYHDHSNSSKTQFDHSMPEVSRKLRASTRKGFFWIVLPCVAPKKSGRPGIRNTRGKRGRTTSKMRLTRKCVIQWARSKRKEGWRPQGKS